MSAPKNAHTLRNLLRLLSYTKKYWFRLTIGILAGMVVGGSLFVTLLMIPQFVGVVKDPAPVVKVVQDGQLKQAVDLPASTILENDPQLKKMLEQADKAAKSFCRRLRHTACATSTTSSVFW